MKEGKKERLESQVDFIVAIDQLKEVNRRSCLVSEERLENSAEHSWHVAVLAIVLSEYADVSLDLCKVVQMLLIHDIVEIEAGDTYAYDPAGKEDQFKRECLAAEHIFWLLPSDQKERFTDLWHEFEDGETLESQFAEAMDRLMPLLHNYYTAGRSWKKHGISPDQVRGRFAILKKNFRGLGRYVNALIEDSIRRGYFP